MKKLFSIILLAISILCLCLPLSGCKASINQNREEKVMIGDINFSSLTEAVKNAKSGDKIEIHNDISDNKNVLIDKSITIVGKPNSSNVKPKFYGSLTIDAKLENDSVNIENLEIINPGKYDEEPVNNTLYAINLIDGGLNIKNCKIMPNEKHDDNTCGIVISRATDSISNMPITISGNQLGCFEYNGKLNSAILIKNNKSGQYKNLNLNADLIKSKNTFDYGSSCNHIISVDYGSVEAKYPYIVSSNADFVIDKLKNNGQSNNFNHYTLINATSFNKDNDDPVYVLSNTFLTFAGAKPLDLKGTTFKVAGSVDINSSLQNATFERTTDTASIVFGENISQDNVEII
ncbi:MAG: hypothetical protein IJS74_02735 [Clostridia bacterium]|nr:hypothetical protein [Clostridia bacterium]